MIDYGKGRCRIKGNPGFIEGDTVVVYQPNERRFYTYAKELFTSGGIEEQALDIPAIQLVDKSLETDRVHLMLAVSRDCNLRCGYCFAHGGENRTKMEKEVALAAVRKAVRRDTRELHIAFTGGEPTTNPQVIKACVREAEKYEVGKQYVITTNGVVSPSLLEYLVSKRFRFSISLDGRPAEHDAFRTLASGEGSSKYVHRTIKTLNEAGVWYRVRSTITPESVESMPEIIEFFSTLNVKFAAFELMDNWGRAVDSNLREIGIDRFMEGFDKALDAAERLGIILVNSSLINFASPSRQRCTGPIGKQIMITPEGRMTRCHDVMDEKHYLSDLLLIGEYDREKKEFVIYENKKEFVDQLDRFTVDQISACGDCHVKYLCSGACLARHMCFNGRKDMYEVSDRVCDLNRGIIDLFIRKMWNSKKGLRN